MRYLSKAFVVVIGLLAIGALSSSVRADGSLVGKFTLHHPAKWNNTVLPAGDYTLFRTERNADLLFVRGAKQTLYVPIFGKSDCKTCQSGSLSLAVQGDNRFVTSLEMAGFHVGFKVRQSPAERGEELGKVLAASEQVAIHVDPN
jgi:hypothetical protein